MKDMRVKNYISTLNQLYQDTGLLVEAETEIYEINQPHSANRVVAILKWDDQNATYYADYKDELCE